MSPNERDLEAARPWREVAVGSLVLVSVANARLEEAEAAALMLESWTRMPLRRGWLLVRQYSERRHQKAAVGEEAVISLAVAVVGEPMRMAAAEAAQVARKAQQRMEEEVLVSSERMARLCWTAFES